MKTGITFVLFAIALLTAGSMMLASPGHAYTGRPSDPRQAKVWIQNTPLGVQVQNVPRVEVSGVPTVTLSAGTVVQARLVRQLWEYRVITISSAQDGASALVTAGADGWEATGVQWQPNTSAASLLLKRPR